jgi:DNA-binding Lrp family transcriptional regulator
MSFNEFESLIKKHLSPYLKEFSYISGPKDILLKIDAENTDKINSLLEKIRWDVPGISKSESFFVLENVKIN